MNADPITAFTAALRRIQDQVQRIEQLEARLARLEQASTRPPRFVRLADAARELERSTGYIRDRVKIWEGVPGVDWCRRQDPENEKSNILINPDAFREWEAEQ
jgi:cell division septum initiation protein DivIVA